MVDLWIGKDFIILILIIFLLNIVIMNMNMWKFFFIGVFGGWNIGYEVCDRGVCFGKFVIRCKVNVIL